MSTTEAPASTDRTAADVIVRVTELVPWLREHARDTELARHIPDATLAALTEAGVFALTLPVDRGGYEATPRQIAEALAQIARGDPSAAWVAAIMVAMGYITGALPDEGAEELLATPDLRMSGLLTPTGTAEPTDGGVIVSGKWLWNTGGRHSQWIGLAALEKTDKGPVPVFALAPSDKVHVHDNWDASGMSGTATNIVTADQVFVPRYRILNVPDLAAGAYDATRRYHGNPYYSVPWVQFTSLIAACPFPGMARGAMDVYLGKVYSSGITYTTYAKKSEAPLTHHQVAKATFDLQISEFYLGQLADVIDRTFGHPATLEDRVLARAYLGQVVRYARSSVNELFNASGASAIQHSAHIQRYFRDVNSLALHAIVQPTTSDELYGRTLLGLEPNTSYL